MILFTCISLAHMALTFDIPIDEHYTSILNQPYFIPKWFENQNPFQNCDWMESYQWMRTRWTHYITNDESPFWRHVKSNKCFRESDVYHRHHLSIVCCHVLCSSSSFCYMILKDQQNPGGCSPHLTCGIRLSNQTNHFTTDNTNNIIVMCGNKLHPYRNTHNRTQNTSCVFFTNKFRLFICFDLVSVRILYSLQLTYKNKCQNSKRNRPIAFIMNKINTKPPRKNFSWHSHSKSNCHN